MFKRMAKKITPKKQNYGTLHELLILKLRVLHDVENQIIKALPKMQKAATDPKLKQAFADHLEETKMHEERIDRALEKLGDQSKGRIKSEAMTGLAKDGEWVAKNIKDRAARDAALIGAAQYVEHYEMAGYKTAIAWAELMGHTDVVELLQETMDEEENADTSLSALAESSINRAVESGMDSEEKESDA